MLSISFYIFLSFYSHVAAVSDNCLSSTPSYLLCFYSKLICALNKRTINQSINQSVVYSTHSKRIKHSLAKCIAFPIVLKRNYYKKHERSGNNLSVIDYLQTLT